MCGGDQGEVQVILDLIDNIVGTQQHVGTAAFSRGLDLGSITQDWLQRAGGKSRQLQVRLLHILVAALTTAKDRHETNASLMQWNGLDVCEGQQHAPRHWVSEHCLIILSELEA